MESDVSTIDPEYVIDRLERIEPGLGPGARILRRRYGINGFRNDQSAIQGQMPLFVLQPREFYDVQAVCRLATQLCAENNGVPPVAIVPRGGGTGMCGGAVPVRPSIVLDMTYMDRCLINHVHDDYSYCWVGPGVTVGRLNDADVHGNYFFPGIPIGASDITHSSHGIAAFDWIFARPVFRSSDFVQASSVPKPTAARLIKQMLASGVIEELHPGRGPVSAIYRFPALMQIVDR